MKQILLLVFLAFTNLILSQSKGTVTGTVTDKEMNGEPLPFANVFIKGTAIGATTDMDGKYTMNVPEGSHTIVFSFVGYETVEKSVSVVGDQVLTVDQLLGAHEGVSLDEVKITAVVSKEKESAIILAQKKAVAIKTSIGAQELSKKGVSNAAAAVTKVAGVLKGSKNVVVRGLGDRYNATTLNGLPLPSEDPEYKNINLDFFDTSIIQQVEINKVFSADLYSDVGGANVNIVSKELNKKRVANLAFSFGGNSQTLTKNFLTIDGTNRFGTQKLNHSVTDLNTYSFQNSLKPNSQNFQLDNSFSFNYGKKYLVGENGKLSFFLVGGMSGAYNFTEGNIKQTNTNAQVFLDQDFSKYSYDVSQLVMGNVKFKSDKGFSLAYNHLFIHSNKQSIGDYFGLDNPEEDGDLVFQRRQQTNNNELYVNQLIGNFKVSERLTIEAKGALNFVRGNEPDRRVNNYLLRDEFYSPQINSAGENERFYSKLQENDYVAQGKISYKLKEDEEDKSRFDFGADYRYTERLFSAYMFNHGFSVRVPIAIENPDAVFNQNTLNDLFYLETGRGRDFRVFDPFTYRGKRLVSGVNANVVYQFGEDLIFYGGLRFEKNEQRVAYDTNIATSVIDGPSYLNRTYLLPSFNVKYNFNENSIVRLAASKTYTFPQFKETAPFKYQDVSFSSQGNPNLKPADNYNFDVKYEYYFSSKELASVTGFYKYINNPIARSEIPSGGNTLTYLNVGENASVYGFEFEARKNILKSSIDTKNECTLDGGMNASFLVSKVNLDRASIAQFSHDSSELEGAAPLIVNADVTLSKKYENAVLTSSLVVNYVSDKVYSIGTRTFENIIEKGIPTLDVVSSLTLTNKYKIKLKATNLLDPSYQLTREGSGNQGNVVLRDFKKGINLSIGFSYDF